MLHFEVLIFAKSLLVLAWVSQCFYCASFHQLLGCKLSGESRGSWYNGSRSTKCAVLAPFSFESHLPTYLSSSETWLTEVVLVYSCYRPQFLLSLLSVPCDWENCTGSAPLGLRVVWLTRELVFNFLDLTIASCEVRVCSSTESRSFSLYKIVNHSSFVT